MSVAGIRSNRGDDYQTLVAFDWTLTVLDDPEYQWLEVDSVKFDVEDIVISKTDGTLICCQCKKNQTHFKAWSLADLADELQKAYNLLDQNKSVNIRFYSRDSFGMLAKLREYSITQPDETRYNASLPKNLQGTNSEIIKQLSSLAPNLSSYEFISHTRFETTPDFDRMEYLLRERLHRMVSSSDAVYNALWRSLDQLGARSGGDVLASALHCLTKDDLKGIVLQAGGFLAQPINSESVRNSFASTSSIGRSWRRDIAGQCLPRPVLGEILSAIDSRQKAILLTGLPGSGKTCVMLSLQDALEKRAKTDSNIIPLFIQSREFAHLETVQDRNAQGLPEHWVEEVARMAEEAHVVVVIDSLDVLSIAREHKVLTYFLTQIDRLLGVPNVTVITACRDFDRHYDLRIAERQWDCEFKCGRLDWEAEVKPLLETINIDTDSIETETQELIKNPRELALFVELAQREDSCNVVTSQELALRYLDTFIRKDPALGDDALKAIEKIAEEMLKVRKLTIPHQRVSIPDIIKRQLSSLNIIQETQGGELTFGHQTLLDVLVISGALRKKITLNEFIQNLPPVPFVRPCIRSFIEQLALGNRREFRKQLRTVLNGNAAFHIRRLVAESLAEQIPLDEDWPLIRELRNKYKDVFQVIYRQARRIEWYHFWNKHLVPILFDLRDAEGLNTHLHRTSLWKNDDTKGILAFWAEILKLDYMDKGQLARQLSSFLEDIDDEYLDEAAPLLEKLLDLPRLEHSLLGHSVARYVSAGVIDDVKLWQYIAGDINDEDDIEYKFSKKLHCQSYEFGNQREDFLNVRMVQSVALLDLAICSIEKWSQIKSSHYGITDQEYCGHFLDMTSYYKAHSQRDYDHENSENILFDAVEKAILNHAQNQSEWWQNNSKRLCFNHEGALRYIGVLACTDTPQANIGLIGRLLADKNILDSRQSYELGILIKNAFIYLNTDIQETVIQTVLYIYEDRLSDEQYYQWGLRKRSEYISFIPCHLRSPEAQSILDDYERINGRLIPRPAIMSSGGTVRAPFSFDKFLYSSDDTVLRLINHYSGYKRSPGLDDFLIGGEEQVGMELREASSRNPARFLELLTAYWNEIPCRFRDSIMDGIANHLACRFGNLQTSDKWEPVETPEGSIVANQIIAELERHSSHWHHNRAASSAIQACSHVINDTSNATRLIFLCLGYDNFQEEHINEDRDLITAGINMTSGHVAEAAIILANHLLENNIPLPELLPPTLLRFARSKYKAHRALILRRLAYLQSKDYDLGWEVFHAAMECPAGLWKHAEKCLYHASYENYDIIEPLLNQIYNKAQGEELEVWGRISALSSLSGHLEQSTLLNDLQAKDSTDGWKGAAKVWTHSGNIKHFRKQCLTGIETGLNANITHALVVALEMKSFFHKENITVSVPVELIQLCFNVLESDTSDEKHGLFGIDEWLNSLSQLDPEYALTATEIYLDYITRLNMDLHDYHNNFTQLITRLFAEAEECEEVDSGAMLQRVVSLQDILLSKGVNNINDWLKAAERP
jgi:ATPase family associated with various cellular activities (AAA)